MEEPQRVALARDEHERWVRERRLGGWHLASPRDDARMVHDELVPWSARCPSPLRPRHAQVDQVLSVVASFTQVRRRLGWSA